MTWNDTSSNETGFIIYREALASAGLRPQSFGEIARVDPNVESYEDLDVALGNEYSYQVAATGSGGTSTPAPPSGTVPTGPLPGVALTLTFDGSGIITIEGPGSTRDCSEDCSLPYGVGDEVTLTAVGSGDLTFAGWTGACTAAGPCTLSLDEDADVGARFREHVLVVENDGDSAATIDVTPGESGSTDECLVAPGSACAFAYTSPPAPLSVSILLSPVENQAELLGFSGCGPGSGGTYCLVTVNGGIFVTATVVRAPQAVQDGPYGWLEDQTRTVPAADGVLSNDLDTPGDSLTAVLVSQPSNGNVTLQPNGSFTFTPAPNWNRVVGGGNFASFTYRAVDAYGNESSTAVVEIDVAPVNDPPVFDIDADPGATKDGVPVSPITNFAKNVGPGGGTDELGQTVTFDVTEVPGSGSGTLAFDTAPALSSDGTLSYAPSVGTYGSRTFQAVASDDGGTANGGQDTSGPQTFTITVAPLVLNVAVNGAGSYQVDPAATGGGYAYLTNVTVTAVPDPGQTLTSWGGACAGTPAGQDSCVVAMDADKNVNVNFKPVHTLTVVVGGTGSGTVTSTPGGIDCTGGTCTADFVEGQSVTLSAQANLGSNFTGWGGACSGTTTCQVVMSGDRTVNATFNLGIFPVDVTIGGNGTGTVTSEPPDIDCTTVGGPGGVCSDTFPYGTDVTLSASAGTGSGFAGWSGDCNGLITTCSFKVEGVVDVGATFTLEKRQLAVTKDGSGAGTVTSTPSGIDCGGDCSEDYDYDTSVTLTAAPATGSSFAGWGGACSGSQTTCVVSMTANLSVTANFTLETHSLTTSVTGDGSVTSDPSGITCSGAGGDCQETFDYDTSVTLTAAPGTGSTFAGWSGACELSTNPVCAFAMTTDRSVTATFTLDAMTLSTVVTGGGSGNVTSDPAGVDCDTADGGCQADFDYGTVVELSASPGFESRFDGWSGDCAGTDPRVCDMTTDRTVGASFALNDYTLTVVPVPTAGKVTGSGLDCGDGATEPATDCALTVPYDTSVTLTAVPVSHHVFDTWIGCVPTAVNPCTTNVTADANVSATFVPDEHELAVAFVGLGSGRVTSSPTGIDCATNDDACSAIFDHGTAVALTAAPDAPASSFGGWSGCDGVADDVCAITLTDDAGVTASFDLTDEGGL
ncbi:MAG: InlB B-repeat-containing protein [Trueperaceae bacterium]